MVLIRRHSALNLRPDRSKGEVLHDLNWFMSRRVLPTDPSKAVPRFL